MRTPRFRPLMLAVAAGVAAILLTPTAAYAEYYGAETDYAQSSAGPTGDYACATHTGVIACFKAYGDVIYVKDIMADGYAAVAEWSVRTDDPRSGSCVNKLTAGKWGVCNKNFVENQTLWLDGARYDSGEFVDGSPGANLIT
ncbi:hypothetical protein K1W54_22375 [Micromonospora sp. CPCC 205371]|nr:hypothetical protein [Micromonospora sp. CPCC 205371]